MEKTGETPKTAASSERRTRTTAAEVAVRLREQRILVRHFESAGLDDRLRITVGSAADVDRLLAALT